MMLTQALESGDSCTKGFTICVCVVSSFIIIPDPTVITFTREQAGRELQTPVLFIKPAASISSPSHCNAHSLTHINLAVACS
jgi:hypothetical protein